MSVFKPLYGAEPLLEEGLASVCAQDYPVFQVVFGLHSADDPALAVVQRVQARFPDVDIAVVIDPARHGPNGKVGNLINMFPAAKHDLLVIADSDLQVRPDYLRRLAGGFDSPAVGLVTTLYAGLPAVKGIPAQLGATAITHGFLPGALLARAMGRQDCLGATMCLRRETLLRIGGFHALVNHLADDNVLGLLVARLGLRVVLATTVPVTAVPESSLSALFRHELRWARTISALAPAAFAASVLQYPLVWALLLVVVNTGAVWAWCVFAAAWILRAGAARGIDDALPCHLETLAFRCPVWLLPLREGLSVAVMLASYAGKQVDWRGHSLHADSPVQSILRSPPPPPAEDPNPR